jgi:hypothetical protein
MSLFGAAVKAIISQESRDKLAQATLERDSGTQKTETDKASAVGDQQVNLAKHIVEKVIGKNIKLSSIEEIQVEVESSTTSTASQLTQASAQVRSDSGATLNYHEERSESQTTSFSLEGRIKTTDGQEIRFDLDFEMTRQFTSELDYSVLLGEAGKKNGPLAIDFEGSVAQLMNLQFTFEIVSDGALDGAAELGPVAGSLVFDRGTVNGGEPSNIEVAKTAADDNESTGTISLKGPVVSQEPPAADSSAPTTEAQAA